MTDSISTNLARWASQKEQRLGMGDVLAQAYRDLKAIGFTTSVRSKLFQNSISASRNEALDDENVIKFLSVVIKIVESNRGIYDGFGGGVMK